MFRTWFVVLLASFWRILFARNKKILLFSFLIWFFGHANLLFAQSDTNVQLIPIVKINKAIEAICTYVLLSLVKMLVLPWLYEILLLIIVEDYFLIRTYVPKLFLLLHFERTSRNMKESCSYWFVSAYVNMIYFLLHFHLHLHMRTYIRSRLNHIHTSGLISSSFPYF